MRFALTLSVNKTAYGNLIPLSYSYELSAWIYKVLASSDEAYASWLHDNGFSLENKRFKFFTFSRLLFDNAKPVKGTDRLAIFSDKATIFLSFAPEISTQNFISGIFSNNEFTIGDRKSKVKFKVESIELLPSPDFSKGYGQFQTLSPITVSMKNDEGKVIYTSPEHIDYDYGQLLLNNLKEKYRIYYGTEPAEEYSFEFKQLSSPRSKLIKIKSGTPAETNVRGFEYTFYMKANPELLRIMHECGAGEKNSVGFGFVEHIDIIP